MVILRKKPLKLPSTIIKYNHGEWSLKFFNEKDFEKPIIEKNDISVNMEELIHPKVFAEFATQKV